MKETIISGIVLLLGMISLSGQDKAENIDVQPILIDKELLSGIGLPKLQLKAHPEREFFQKRIYRGSELTIFILSSETAKNAFDSFPLEEFVYFINGRADVEPIDDVKYSFYPGDFILVPKGFKGQRTNNGGNRYHLELSVISNKRTDSTIISVSKKPFVLDKDLIAGTNMTPIEEGRYSDELHSGIELLITQESEVPNEKNIKQLRREQFIHILIGKLVLTTLNGQRHTFYAGDFFVLPKGFTGKWKSYGADLFRTLRVMQNE